jgi:UPF0176 protein
MEITVTTFYHFTPLAQPAMFQPMLLARMEALGIKGTITLATEGVNATVSGQNDALNQFIGELQQALGIRLVMSRESYTGTQPFKRAKVKVKRELISLGKEANPSVCVGEYVLPNDWNALITRADIIIIDTRNDYEFALGHFKGALNPATRNFKDMVTFTERHLDPASGKSIAMYCTGGIRCEKYSAYLVAQGFTNVYHLHGGILAYIEKIPPEQSLWKGTCFVFDERVAV